MIKDRCFIMITCPCNEYPLTSHFYKYSFFFIPPTCILTVFIISIPVSENDLELENFKNAVRMRQKRSAADVQVLVKCSAPLAQENDGLTDKEKARKLGVCLARDALKKAAARKDNASEMVRRYVG